MYITAVILTKSYKNGGYCVAGIRLDSHEWIRFVSSDSSTHGAITDRDLQYDTLDYCQPFDVVDVPVLQDHPSPLQPENYLIDRSKRWQKIDTYDINQVLQIYPVDNDFFIFRNNWSYLNPEDTVGISRSLIMVKVNNLQINHPYQDDIMYKKCSFNYQGNQYYFMSITDPEYRNAEPTSYIGNAILVVSIPDAPDKNKFYKCISKIIPI